MSLNLEGLKARWKTGKGQKLLRKVYAALHAGESLGDTLAGFPRVDEIDSGLDLRGADLSDADLSGADLSGADLSDADLSGAKLNSSNLSNANLANANLSSTNLIKANLSNANLSSANLIKANLDNANLDSANLSNANLCGANLANAKLNNACLSNADLRGADLGDAVLSGVTVWGAKLDDVDRRDNDLGNANLDGNTSNDARELNRPTPTPASFPRGETSPIIRKRTCPYCAEVVLAEAKKCKHCGEFFVSPVKSGPKPINAGSNGRITLSRDLPLWAQRVFAIVMCLFIAISFDRCVTGCSKSGGGIANDSSKWRSKEERLADYHRQGRFRGYTDPDELQRDMKILGDGGAVEAEAVYWELHWMSK